MKYRYVIPEKDGQPVVIPITDPKETIHFVRSKKESVFESDRKHPELEKFRVAVKETVKKTVPNFRNMTVKQLKAYADTHDISLKSGMRKAEIISLLEKTI